MPAIGSKITLSAAASSSGLAVADIDLIKGAFYTVATSSSLDSIPTNRLMDGQIVWVEDASATYQLTITPANPPITFSDTYTWAEFSGFGSGGGGSTTLGGLTDVSTGSLSNGQVLQYNSSTGKWEASSVSGTGDISAVFAGDGLSGGGTAGSVSLDVVAGNGISLTGGVSIDTGSSHFINGVIDLAIFQQTGSVYNTTNDLGVTGSLTLRKDDGNGALAVYSGSIKTFEITGDGLLKLVSQSSTPTAVAGALYLDTDYNLYIGQE